MSFILCVGEALIDFVAQTGVGDVGASEYFRRSAGGAVANVAVGVARLGGAAHFAGTLGSDPFGRYLLRTLAHENVNVDGVRMVDASTSLAFVARGPGGDRDFSFVRNPGADSLLESSDIPDRELSQARIVHFGGVLLASEPARSACFAAAAASRSAGALVSFDANVRPPLWSSAAELKQCTLAACATATLVKVSEDDLAALEMKSDDAGDLLGEVTRAVVLTRGERGASFFTAAGERGDVMAPPVDVVDTTGAGDASTAAILWRLERLRSDLSRAALEDAVRCGTAAGTFACLREGAIPSLPRAADLEAMLAEVISANEGRARA